MLFLKNIKRNFFISLSKDTPYKRQHIIAIVLVIFLIVSILVFAIHRARETTSNSAPNTTLNGIELSENTAISPLELPSLSAAPQAPLLPKQETTIVSVPQGVQDSELTYLTQSQKDKWFTSKIRESGILLSQETALSLRQSVCNSLRSGTPVNNIMHLFSPYSLNEEQIGTIIGFSMISGCSDLGVTIQTRDMPTSQ